MKHQLALLAETRFRGLFWTQFLGAFNDNFFKNALVILILFRGLTIAGMTSEMLTVVAAGLFILPFFLFSATAGQLADKYEKSGIIRLLKVWEVGISILGAYGLVTGDLGLLLFVLFAFALQSAFFGPVKYGILPQLLPDEQLLRGNALVETGTSLSVLAGTIAGGVLVALDPRYVAGGVVLIALAGLATSRTIPIARAAAPELRVNWFPVRPTLECLSLLGKERSVLLSVLGISWFWLYVGAFVTLLPVYGRGVLSAGENVVTLLIALFTGGIAIGALVCDRLSHNRIELGLVPLGTLGMTLFAVDLFWLGAPYAGGDTLELMAFLSQPAAWRVCLDLFLIALFSALFLVPLFAVVQKRTDEGHRSRVIAGNNIANSLFMVASTVFLIVLLQVGLSVPQIFGVLALMNGAVAIYIYGLLPEFFLRFVSYSLAHVVYRLRTVNLQSIPAEGGALLVCNHLSHVDWLILHAAIPRPVRFVMGHTYAEIPLLHYLFRDARVIPIASGRTHPERLQAAYDQIAEELQAGELVCIFPEGRLSSDGQPDQFRPGLERILERTPVPVIPLALQGLWGSTFSRAPRRIPRRLFRARIQLVCGSPEKPGQGLTAARCRAQVADLLRQDGSNAPAPTGPARLILESRQKDMSHPQGRMTSKRGAKSAPPAPVTDAAQAVGLRSSGPTGVPAGDGVEMALHPQGRMTSKRGAKIAPPGPVVDAVQAALEALGDGQVLAIFPEGRTDYGRGRTWTASTVLAAAAVKPLSMGPAARVSLATEDDLGVSVGTSKRLSRLHITAEDRAKNLLKIIVV